MQLRRRSCNPAELLVRPHHHAQRQHGADAGEPGLACHRRTRGQARRGAGFRRRLAAELCAAAGADHRLARRVRFLPPRGQRPSGCLRLHRRPDARRGLQRRRPAEAAAPALPGRRPDLCRRRVAGADGDDHRACARADRQRRHRRFAQRLPVDHIRRAGVPAPAGFDDYGSDVARGSAGSDPAEFLLPADAAHFPPGRRYLRARSMRR